MARYYVAKTGVDTNAGTFAAPWLTVQKAVTTMVGGDYTFIRAGIYSENVATVRSGSAGNYIHLFAYKGEKVIIDGGASYALHDIIGVSYIYLQGLELRTTDTVEYALGLDKYPTGGSDNWVISSCRIKGQVYLIGANLIFSGNYMDAQGGFANAVRELLSVSNNNKFIGNTIKSYTIRGFWSTNTTHNTSWLNNQVDDCFNGIDADGYGTVEYLHVIKRNLIRRSLEVGIQMENCFDCIVSENHLIGCLAGIEWILYGAVNDPGAQTRVTFAGGYGSSDNDAEGEDSMGSIINNVIEGGTTCITSFQAGSLDIINNTLQGSLRGIWLNSNSPNQLIRNNAFVDKGIFCTTFTHIATDDHNAFAANPAYDNGSAATLAAYITATSRGSGSLVGSLSLTGMIPAASSILVNAGLITLAPTRDILRIARPIGAAVDIGAYEVA